MDKYDFSTEKENGCVKNLSASFLDICAAFGKKFMEIKGKKRLSFTPRKRDFFRESGFG